MEWNASPEIFNIGGFTLRWYGLFFASGLMIGYFIMGWVRRRELTTTAFAKSLDLDILLVVLVAGTVIGARLFHALFYQWDYFQNHLIEILYVWKGGLASHGGTLGILLALWIYTKKTGISILWLLDRLAIPIMLTAGLIRMGNFANSEIIGTVTNVPWAIIFKATASDLPRHPVQLYEAFAYLSLFIGLLLSYVKTQIENRRGMLFGIMLLGTFASRFIFEYFKMRLVLPAANESASIFSVGQWSSIPFVLAGLYLIVMSKPAPHNGKVTV
ncbi:Prolipoprotein diacylglyceryl transferase [hydrothermal vent metagenome]|uniref:Prolipoprotein diacylglyceryl transferase n=1 Tax=hydrothermal vent metagenome TaxID=652676 RepID=A0A3B0Z7C4_9ZZZZ